ncbi:hypothetical protein [Chenggangzhangella methanolivorans]|uniref:hypothetical protein n=1 Tax=Chenggangzhangella methanolivorans TaxID=1437009 RepID=UPI0021BD5827|nr:hypothetical protein [Chenggangzhangella methanolivorans]
MARPLTRDAAGLAPLARTRVAVVDGDLASTRVATSGVATAGGGEVVAALAHADAASPGALRGAALAVVDLPERGSLETIDHLRPLLCALVLARNHRPSRRLGRARRRGDAARRGRLCPEALYARRPRPAARAAFRGDRRARGRR